MKIVSDFDGVWTDPTSEADLILQEIRRQLCHMVGAGEAEVTEHVAALVGAIAADPSRHGWSLGGVLTAFADEDPYMRNNGVCMALASGEPAVGDASLREACARALGEAFGSDAAVAGIELAQRTYHDGSRLAIDTGAVRVHEGAAATLERLLRAGCELVIVSNSSSDKVIGLLAAAGIDASADGGAPLRARGGARKFWLEAEPPPPGGEPARDFAGRRVRLDRGPYQRLLREEEPGLVVGDVFCLDLALPYALRAWEDGWSQLHLALVQNHYTPGWALDATGLHEHDLVVEDLDELAAWIETRSA